MNNGKSTFMIVVEDKEISRVTVEGTPDVGAVLDTVRGTITRDTALDLYQYGGRLLSREQLATLRVELVGWSL